MPDWLADAPLTAPTGVVIAVVLVRMPARVAGGVPVDVADVVADEATAPEPEPDEVMLNSDDWARMAWLSDEVETRLMRNAVPSGQLPEGKETCAVFCTLGEPRD